MPTPIEEPLQLELPPALAELLATVPELSQAYVVGGGVRDAVLGQVAKDLDLEVFGTDYDQLGRALARFGATDLVGRAFGVIRLTLASGEVVDFSLPRRDSKVGAGHRGFAVAPDPTLSPREAASRRDFTVNALMYDPRRRVVADHFGGLADLRAGVLRHVGPAFSEDPLRVLRGMQFAARFELRAAPETVALCKSIASSHRELPLERVREEWFKWASLARRPSLGLAFLRDTGWLEHYPELSAMVGVEQDAEWHPEGDVWVHTLHALDALVTLPEWHAAEPARRLVWTFAVLLHDAGKPSCTRREPREGRVRIVSPGHDVAGGPLAAAFLERIGAPQGIAPRVLPLVAEHMAHLQAATDRSVRRLSVRLKPETVQSLAVVITADHSGRPPRPAGAPDALVSLLERAEKLAVSAAAPRHVLSGWHLIEAGLEEGPELGQIVRAAYEAQLDGTFAQLADALRWLYAHERWGERMRQAAARARAALPAGFTELAGPAWQARWDETALALSAPQGPAYRRESERTLVRLAVLAFPGRPAA